MADESSPATTLTTDVLIIGAGPAGASLASFLGYYGIQGIMVSRDTSTAIQTRAHYTNPGAWECLRDVGLEDEWRRVSLGNEWHGDHRHCNTLAGKDFVRTYGFGHHPDAVGDYQTVSPCTHGEVGQNDGEPLLVKYATQHGFKLRFNTKFLQYDIDETTDLITTTLLDQLTGLSYKIVSKYLCGADGANSAVARQAGLPFHTISGGSNAMNFWYEADLSHLHKKGDGLMHSLFTPDLEIPEWGPWGLNRAVRPFSEFVMTIVAFPGAANADVSQEQVVERVRQLIGDPNIEIKVKGLYRWRVNESYAEMTSKDSKIFCLGDAIHRHPPGNGLGSNTCIQDAYNLAWKLAYVLQGKAGPQLLTSYNSERQPVAKRIVRVANDCLRIFAGFFQELGVLGPSIETRMATLNQLEEAGPQGAARRAALSKAKERILIEKSGLGGEMNQAYVSNAISFEDESDPNPGWESGDAGVRHHVISTYPGSRLPHAWLGTNKFGEKVSTHDLAGKGQFTIFTGIGGKDAWQASADATMKQIGSQIKINVRAIGFGQEFSDMYGTWELRRGVEDEGAILVRPDRTVAWRSKQFDKSSAEQLTRAVKHILALD